MLFSVFAEEGQSINRSGSGTRLASLSRLPRTPVGNAFESAEDSDEDGTEHANEDDITYSNENVDAFAYMISVCLYVVSASYFKMCVLSVCSGTFEIQNV